MFRDRAGPPAATKRAATRRYELDWLRVVIILGAMVFHAVYEMQIYFPQTRSDTVTTVIQVGSTFAIQWGLPLLFLIAGASAWLSLAHRTGRQFVKERVLHLLVPFIGCVLTIIPISMYFASLIPAGPHSPFLQFYADYFQRYTQFFQGNPLDQLIAFWGTLWFIFVIFLLSLLLLPLILLLRGPHGVRVIGGCVAVCQIPGGTLMAGLLFVVWSWFLGMVLPTTAASTVWVASLCVLSFIAGVLLYAEPAIEQAVERDGPAALVLATLCFVVEQILVATDTLPLPHSGGYTVSAILAGCFPWFGAIGVLGVAKRLLSFTTRALEYLKEAVFPYFLLHMLVLALFGYIFLEYSRLPGVVQGVAIMICSALSLALLYEFVIKRVAFTRFIFGMKARPRA
jgi:hypothetical protein